MKVFKLLGLGHEIDSNLLETMRGRQIGTDAGKARTSLSNFAEIRNDFWHHECLQPSLSVSCCRQKREYEVGRAGTSNCAED